MLLREPDRTSECCGRRGLRSIASHRALGREARCSKPGSADSPSRCIVACASSLPLTSTTTRAPHRHDHRRAARRDWEQARSAARIAWIEPERLHLTLQFIGEVSDESADAIVTRLRPRRPSAAVRDAPRVASARFPPSGRPRVVWLGVDARRRARADLHAEIARRLADIASGARRGRSRRTSPWRASEDGGRSRDSERIAERRSGARRRTVHRPRDAVPEPALAARSNVHAAADARSLTGAERVA